MTRNKRLRFYVFKRDHGICARCSIFDPKWEADHVLPLSLGGRDALDNLETLCRRHHSEKTVAETPARAKADRLRERAELTRKRKPILVISKAEG